MMGIAALAYQMLCVHVCFFSLYVRLVEPTWAQAARIQEVLVLLESEKKSHRKREGGEGGERGKGNHTSTFSQH